MATVNITEVLGSDGVSGSRNRINSNFNVLSNWINNYNDVFSIDTNNGILDITDQTTGKLAAKIGAFNSIAVPASGTTKASVSSAGAAAFVSISTQSLTASGTTTFSSGSSVSFNSNITFAVGSTADLNGQTNIGGRLALGNSSSITNTSLVYNTGLTAGTSFPDSDNGTFPHGGGYATTASTPYEITGTENIIYADLGSTGGFNLSVGVGTTASGVPAGFELTLINTNDAGGTINTGVQGSFYTGFNTNASQGGWPAAGITAAAGLAYRSSLKLLWEPRVDQDSASQKGSWVVLSATNMSV